MLIYRYPYLSFGKGCLYTPFKHLKSVQLCRPFALSCSQRLLRKANGWIHCFFLLWLAALFKDDLPFVRPKQLPRMWHQPFFFQNRGPPECAFCPPLCAFSVLTYALTDKKTSKWQDSTLCILPLGHAKLQATTKKTTLCLRHSGPVGLLGFLGSRVFFFFFFWCLFFLFSHFAWMYHWLGSQSASVNILLFCPYLALSHHPTPWKVSPCLLSHTSGYYPNMHVFLIFSWFGHPPRKLLKKMGENTTQPRLENIISKQVSAWPLTFLFKSSNICLMQYFFENITFLA